MTVEWSKRRYFLTLTFLVKTSLTGANLWRTHTILFNLYQNTDQRCLVDQLPIWSCFHLYVTWRATWPLPPGNPGNSGNAEAKCIIDCVVFFYKKGWGGENYQSQNKFTDVMSAGKKEGFVRLGSGFGKFVTYIYLHSDTGLYPLQGPATFLTFYFFKRLSISNANAASSKKQYFQSR